VIDIGYSDRRARPLGSLWAGGRGRDGGQCWVAHVAAGAHSSCASRERRPRRHHGREHDWASQGVDLISFPFQDNTNFNYGPLKGTRDILNVQLVIPIHLNQDWQLDAQQPLKLWSWAI
jgi:hypothetical protein